VNESANAIAKTNTIDKDILNKDIYKYFGTNTRRRGQNYVDEKRVLSVDYSDDIDGITGSVQGTQTEPYMVEVFISPEDSTINETDCTCPVGIGCKHAAALTLSFVQKPPAIVYGTIMLANGSEEIAFSEIEPELKNTSKKQSTVFELDSVLQARLQGLVQSYNDTKSDDTYINRTKKNSKQRVLYILKNSHFNLLTVDVVSAFVNKYGGYGKEHPCYVEQFIQSSAGYVQPEDVAIAKLWRKVGNSYSYRSSSSLCDDPELFDILLKRIIETGRCHWMDKDNPPLTLGAHRSGHLQWIMNDYGKQLLRLTPDDANAKTHALYSASPWYVDETTWQAGPLLSNLKLQTIEAILNIPPLESKQAISARLWLQENVSLGEIPLPAADIETEVKLIKPNPSIRLASNRTIYKYSDRESVGIADYVYLSFDYPELFSSATGTLQEKVSRTDKTIIIEKPDLQTRDNYIHQLEDLGLHRIRSNSSDARQLCFQLNDSSDWLSFMQNSLNILRSNGWKVDIDQSFSHQIIEAEEEWSAEVEDNGGWWFSLDLGVTIEGKKVPLLPILVSLLRRMESDSPLESLRKVGYEGKVLFPMSDGRLLELPFERVAGLVETLVELFAERSTLKDSKLQLSALALAPLLNRGDMGNVNWIGAQKLKQLAEKLMAQRTIERVKQPKGLTVDLREYQLDGLSWLQFLRQNELGGVLADDMGLGKTVQALSHILLEIEQKRLDKPCLVICPTSVVPNWVAEASRLAPKIKVLALHGAERAEKFSQISKAQLVITTYPLILRDFEHLNSIAWYCIILDESQAVKNSNTQASQLIRQLKAHHRLCLTGTPVENHLGEIWSQFAFLMPGLLGDIRTFNSVFRTPIEKKQDSLRRKLLAARLRPFIIRRTKNEVATELPSKENIIQRIELDGPQRDLYETVRISMHEKVRQEIANKGLARSQIIILDALLKLRQVCCDPQLVKLSAAQAVKGSAKLITLLGMLEELVEEGRRILLFSQFTSMLNIIKPELAKRQIDFVEITGETKDRETPVLQFQNGNVPLFLISLKAGGTGLNLTAADTVIHYDPWWNPAVEDQATDRAHRIGQTKNIFVYKLIAAGTIEERMLELQERKRVIAQAIYNPETSGSISFDESDLELLFQPICK